MGRGGAVVALGEGVDDGQAESGAAGGAGGVGAGESVEGVWQEIGVKAWAVVADSDVDSPVVAAAGSDGDWWGFVFDGVVDEVADDPVEVVRVDADVLAGWAFDTDFVAESVAVASGDGVSR